MFWLEQHSIRILNSSNSRDAKYRHIQNFLLFNTLIKSDLFHRSIKLASWLRTLPDIVKTSEAFDCTINRKSTRDYNVILLLGFAI